MPGFWKCSWCGGKGCMCCDSEKVKWEKQERERLEREANEDPRERLTRLQNPLLRAITEGFGGAEAVAILDRDIAAAEAACDAEYQRQFPNGPTPIFTARRDNPKDMELLKEVFSAGAIEKAFGDGGGGLGEVLKNAEAARARQDPSIEYKPIGG